MCATKNQYNNSYASKSVHEVTMMLLLRVVIQYKRLKLSQKS